MIASWIKDDSSWGGDRWLKNFLDDFSRPSLNDMVEFWEKTKLPQEEYFDWLERNGYGGRSERFSTPEEDRRAIYLDIKEKLMRKSFFNSTLMKAIISGSANIERYKELSFKEALEKYNYETISDPAATVLEYDDGWKWINVGKKCEMIGDRMSNCGSVGVMSLDEDRTMISLFNPTGEPRLLLTWSPNEKRISGVEGKGGSAPKPEYFQYVKDLADKLNASFIENSLGEKRFPLWAYFITGNEPKMVLESVFDKFYELKTPDGIIWITNGNAFITKDNFELAKRILIDDPYFQDNVKKLKERDLLSEVDDDFMVRAVFSHVYEHILEAKMPSQFKVNLFNFEKMYKENKNALAHNRKENIKTMMKIMNNLEINRTASVKIFYNLIRR